jgi:hypothetical protein
MNIFKVIASAPRGKFYENQASAILAWLLNPKMDHGLGYIFLNKFLERVGVDDDTREKLKTSINDNNDNLKIDVNLEYFIATNNDKNTSKAVYIDIVLIINDYYYITIENKIDVNSASEDQLKNQYDAVKFEMESKEKENKDIKGKTKVIVVFLVPSKTPKIQQEYDELKPEGQNKAKIIEWKEIVAIIKDILQEEHSCEISPINEYSKHTLKALSIFIDEDFMGYKEKNNDQLNPKADRGRLAFYGICADENIKFVGIKNGLTGLKQDYNVDDLEKYGFQCTTANKQPNSQWITRQQFIDHVKSRLESSV